MFQRWQISLDRELRHKRSDCDQKSERVERTKGSRLTQFRRRESQDSFDVIRGVEEHTVQAQLRPILVRPIFLTSQPSNAIESVPGHVVNFSRSSNEDDTFTTFTMFDCESFYQSALRKSRKKGVQCNFPLASSHM